MIDQRIFTTRLGLRLDAPSPGDIVTVRIKRRPRHAPASSSATVILSSPGMEDEADNPQHYRMTSLWRVLAINGGQTVVQSLLGYTKGTREIWPIGLHEWYEASDLAEILLTDEAQ